MACEGHVQWPMYAAVLACATSLRMSYGLGTRGFVCMRRCLVVGWTVRYTYCALLACIMFFSPQWLAARCRGCASVSSGDIGCCRSVCGSCYSTPRPPHDAPVNAHASSYRRALLGAGTYDWCSWRYVCTHIKCAYQDWPATAMPSAAHPPCMYCLKPASTPGLQESLCLPLYLSA